MPHLSVNIDHVATLRQARYRAHDGLGEPDPVRAAHEAELGGADGITLHLREDRRHMQDRDLDLLRGLVNVRLNLEMAATEEMVTIALRAAPHTAMLVPEGRDEVTTEGGLDVAGQAAHLAPVVRRLHEGGMFVSAFIDADPVQVDAAAAAGFDICELHTGPYAAAFTACGGDFRRDRLDAEVRRLEHAGRLIRAHGMRFNAGHALNYHNVARIARLGGVEELHIGHAIVARSVYVGMRQAVRDMQDCLRAAVLAG